MRAAAIVSFPQNAHGSRRDVRRPAHDRHIGCSLLAYEHGLLLPHTEHTRTGGTHGRSLLRRHVWHNGLSVFAPRQRRSRPQPEHTAIGST